jgi:hypothetical protein
VAQEISLQGAAAVVPGQTRTLMTNAVAVADNDHEQPIRDDMSCNAGRMLFVEPRTQSSSGCTCKVLPASALVMVIVPKA